MTAVIQSLAKLCEQSNPAVGVQDESFCVHKHRHPSTASCLNVVLKELQTVCSSGRGVISQENRELLKDVCDLTTGKVFPEIASIVDRCLSKASHRLPWSFDEVLAKALISKTYENSRSGDLHTRHDKAAGLPAHRSPASHSKGSVRQPTENPHDGRDIRTERQTAAFVAAARVVAARAPRGDFQ